MANEKGDANTSEKGNDNDVELEEGDEGEESENGEGDSKAGKRKYTDEEKLSYHERSSAQLRKKLGKVDLESKSTEKSDKADGLGKEMDKGDKAILVAYGLRGSAELALARDYMARTGQDPDATWEDDIFQAKLSKLRKAKESEDAVPKGVKRSKQSAGDELATALAKYSETGELPEDRDLREKVVETRLKKEKASGMFYNG